MKSIAFILATAIFCTAAFAEATEVVRGLAGRVDIEYAHKLRARAEQSPLSPVLVRVTPIPNSTRQTIEFIGSVAGTFDLRDYVERQDGESAQDLAAIPITIVTRLLPDHGTDLYASNESWLNWRAHYRELLWALVVLWALAPVAYFVMRALRKRKPVEASAVAEAAITLEDRLRAALITSASRSLTIEERGQLELLVFRFLADRSEGIGVAGDDPADVLRAVRSHPETRDLVAALERWLHARGGEAGSANASAALEAFRRTRLTEPLQSSTSTLNSAEATA